MRKHLRVFNRLPRTHLVRQMCLWGIVLVAMAALVAVALYVDEKDNERIASTDRLVEHFDALAFGSGRYDQVRKWIVPIRIGLHGEGIEEWRKTVEVIASELEDLTGLDIEVVDPSSDSENLHLHFVSHEELYPLAAFYNDIMNRDELRQITNKTHRLATIKPVSAIEITEAAILITPDHLDGFVIRNIRHEFVHILGMRFHSGAVYPTVMDANYATVLSANDRIVLRTLYDDRITPGMPRDEALRIARDIITELVAEAQSREATGSD